MKMQGVDGDAALEIIKALQDDDRTNPDDLIKIEWSFLPIFDQHNGASPKFLEFKLAENPAFFCEIIRIVFKSNKVEQPSEETHDEVIKIAQNAYDLLRKWKTPPGSQRDGSFDGELLYSWLEFVKNTCSESGHLEIAMTMIGHVMIHTPPDPDGLWIHHSAANVLNSTDAIDMRNGFQTELFNSRGVHSWTAGKEEKMLSDQYGRMAEEVEIRGYISFAVTLRNLADSYARDSESEAAKDPLDDWAH